MRTDSITLSQTAIDAARDAGPRAVRRGVRAGRAARLREQGEERPGGARGDPPGRRPRSAPRPRHSGLRGDELRLYELIWKRTVASPDEGRHAASRSIRAGSERRAPRGGRRTRSSPRPARSSTSTGSCKAYVEGIDDDADAGRRGAPAARAGRGRGAGRAAARRRRARDEAARPVHRGDTGQGARGPGDRPAVHVRQRSSARSSTAATSSRRARRWSRPSWRSRWSRCWSSTSPSSSTTTSPPRWRTRSTRSPAARRTRVPWLRRFYFGDADRAATWRAHAARPRKGSACKATWSPTSATSTPGTSARSRWPAPTS